MAILIKGGDEIPVSSNPDGLQSTPSIAALINGGWVVAWTSSVSPNLDSIHHHIYSQAYNSDGTKSTGETQVSATEDVRYSYREGASIAALSDGGWVVAWVSQGQDGSGDGVYSRAFNKPTDGMEKWGEMLVNTHTAGDQTAPSVAAFGDGRWVVTWESYGPNGGGFDVYSRIYNADGTPSNPQKSETQVNTETDDVKRQGSPSVAVLDNGGWVVTWESDGQDGDGYGIYSQAYNSNGTPLYSDEIRVNTTTNGDQEGASITALKGGGWVVTWESGDGDGDGVYSQAYDSDGNPLRGETRVNTTVEGSQEGASIAALDNGGWVVTWTSAPEGISFGLNTDIYSQAYDSHGNPLGGQILVNTTTERTHTHSSVAGLNDGSWVVTWTLNGQESNGSGDAIYQRRFHFEDGGGGDDDDDDDDDSGLTVSGPVSLEASNEDTQRTLTLEQLTRNATGGDDNFSIANLTVSAGSVTDNGDNTWTYTPKQDDDSEVTFSYSVEDGSGGSVATTATLDLLPVNDDPVVSGPIDLGGLVSNTPRILTLAQLLARANDVDGDTLSVAGLTVSAGTLTDNGDGTWTYVPEADDTGAVTFSYSVEDGNGGSVATTATLDLNAPSGGGGGGGSGSGGPAGNPGITPGSVTIVVAPKPGGGAQTIAGHAGTVDEVQIAGDVVLGANLENAVLTGTGDFSVTGNDLDNVIYGNAGNNLIVASAGRDFIDGGTGFDTVKFDGNAADFIVAIDLPVVTVTGPDGSVTTLADIQQISFDDGDMPLFAVDHAHVQALYLAFLGRDADDEGFAFWMGESLGGLDLARVAAFFTGSEEFQARVAAETPEAIVASFYEQFLQRPAEEAGMAFWLDHIGQGGSYADMAAAFATSNEFAVNIDAILDRGDWLTGL